MIKPLSDTHPTITERYYAYTLNGVEEKYYEAEVIQECTVDRAEHERVLKLYADNFRSNEEIQMMLDEAGKWGEERVLRRVREVLLKHSVYCNAAITGNKIMKVDGFLVHHESAMRELFGDEVKEE